MNKFVTGALALAATSSVGLADPSDSSEWLELDSEINGLASSYSSSSDHMGWAALIRATFTYSTDDIATGGGDDVSGFKMEDVRLVFWGGFGDYSYMVSGNLALEDDTGLSSGDLQLENAYTDWDCGEYFTARMGQFRPHISIQGSMLYEEQIFIDRTPLGSAVDFYDIGIGAMGSYEMFNWSVALQNGISGQDSGHAYILRAEYVMGTGSSRGGALGANDDLNGTAGVSFWREENIGDAQAFLFDVQGTAGPIGFGGEIATLSEDLAGVLTTRDNFSRTASPIGFGDGTDSTTPFSLWGSYLLNQEFEGAVRFDALDNQDDLTIISLVLNWYLSGHNAKWQAQFSNYDGDSDDGTIFQIGLTVGSTI